MNLPRPFIPLLAALALGLAPSGLQAATKRKAPESDLATMEVRRPSVELGDKLAKVENAESLADSALPHPFNPPGFGLDKAPVVEAAPTPGPVRSVGDRELLNALASKIQPKGTFGLGSQSLLSFGKRNLRVGDRLTVNYDGQDYILELVSFDRTNFTLRLNHEEITRPIKPGKNP